MPAGVEEPDEFLGELTLTSCLKLRLGRLLVAGAFSLGRMGSFNADGAATWTAPDAFRTSALAAPLLRLVVAGAFSLGRMGSFNADGAATWTAPDAFRTSALAAPLLLEIALL